MKKILNDLHYDFSRFTLSDFIHWLEEAEQTTILCLPKIMPPGTFAAWFTSDHNTEYILYDPTRPLLHQTHNILHEICHWLLDHSTYCLSAVELENGRLSDAASSEGQFKQLIRLRSIEHGDSAEEEAETLCSLIQHEALKHNRERGLAVLPEHPVISFFDALDAGS